MNRIVVTGGSGLVGASLKKILKDAIYLSSKDFDLTKERDVIEMYEKYNPNTVIHLAAKVGGIIDNIAKPAEYYTDNVLMNTLLVHHAYKYNVERFIGMLSTCIYPDKSSYYPLKEDSLHSGPPTATNFSYGYAKRALAVQIDAYNSQYGTKYQYLIPCNLYGLNDKEDENNSHFVTALIEKIYEAKKNNLNSITLYGDGSPLRQFMLADDLAKIIVRVIDKNIFQSFNVASSENLTIKEIAQIALRACSCENFSIKWDRNKPNGQFRKDVSIDKLKEYFPDFSPSSLFDGIKEIWDSKS